MKPSCLKIATSTVNQTPLDWPQNLAHLKELIIAAQQKDIQLLVTPELSITGYGCQDAFFSEAVQQTAITYLAHLLPLTANITCTFGLPLKIALSENHAKNSDPIDDRSVSNLYNVTAVCRDGKILALIPKKNLANSGLYYESRWFTAWPYDKKQTVQLLGQSVPCGDFLLEVEGITLGFEICEEAWLGSQRSGLRFAQHSVDLVINPSASHFATDKLLRRVQLGVHLSEQLQNCYVLANMMGNESGRMVFDGGSYIASCGRLLAFGPHLAPRGWTLTEATLTFDGQGKVTLPDQLRKPDQSIKAVLPVSDPFEEFTRAGALAIWDFVTKTRSNGVVVSLSGGIDSAAVLILSRFAVLHAANQVETKHFRSALPEGLRPFAAQPDLLSKHWLTAIYQTSTGHSSETTFGHAQLLADLLHASFFEWKIDDIVESFKQKSEQVLDIHLNWQDHDLALQNIQSRSRAPGVWMIANLLNKILLTTGNRSEAAVGYATMDGDTSGGYNPIGSVSKSFLIDWINWLATVGSPTFGRYPSLLNLLKEPPTAELRPLPQRTSDEVQSDEKDLMPYPLLNAIEELWTQHGLLPLEVYKKLAPTWITEEVTPKDLHQAIEKFFRLFARNQWKRERLAPSPLLSHYNLDPKSGYRFPMLSGGFQTELEELSKYVLCLGK